MTRKYAYFPGCSLEKMARSYHDSAMETTRALDVELQEIEDWNCCGATTYFNIDELLAYTLCARNLAIAEQLEAGRRSRPAAAATRTCTPPASTSSTSRISWSTSTRRWPRTT